MLFTVRFLNEQGFLQFLHSPVHIYTALPLLLHISFYIKKNVNIAGLTKILFANQIILIKQGRFNKNELETRTCGGDKRN